MNLKQELGEKIRRIRKMRGLTQEQLAEKIDITSRNLSNIELGSSFPKSATLEKILKTLNISTQELFSNEHIKTNEELLNEINNLLETTRDNNILLSKIYRVIRDILED